jgi:hypothetical protein
MTTKSPEEMLAALRHNIALLQSDSAQSVEWYANVTNETNSKRIVILEDSVTFGKCKPDSSNEASTAGWSGSRESNSLLWLIEMHSRAARSNASEAFPPVSVEDLNQDRRLQTCRHSCDLV